MLSCNRLSALKGALERQEGRKKIRRRQDRRCQTEGRVGNDNAGSHQHVSEKLRSSMAPLWDVLLYCFFTTHLCVHQQAVFSVVGNRYCKRPCVVR